MDIALGPDCFLEVAEDHDSGLGLNGDAVFILLDGLAVHGWYDGDV